MKILFIGGTGTISAACSNLCIERGMDLWLINRGHRDARVRKEANHIKADINKEYKRILEVLSGHEWDCVVDWTVFTEEQILRDIDLFQGRTKHYVFISSTSIYRGTTAEHRLVEDDPVGNSILPPYAEHKIECENILLKEYKNNGFPVTIVRPGHSYAEFTIPTNIPGLGYGIVERIKKGQEIIVHDDGLSLWTLTHCSDFAVGLVGLLCLKECIGGIFHITSAEILTWLEIFETFQELLGIEAKFGFIPSQAIYEIDKEIGASLLGDRAKNLIFDNEKIRKFVKGYNPKISFKEGLRQSLDWHEENKDEIYYNRKVVGSVDKVIDSYGERR